LFKRSGKTERGIVCSYNNIDETCGFGEHLGHVKTGASMD